jgi:hypothetical protein
LRAAPPPPARPAGSAPDVEQLASDLAAVMDALLANLEEETALVRAGHLAQAAALEGRKSELAGRYLAITARMKANAGLLSRAAPQTLEFLRERHDLFRALLQINLAVLATAHAVAEGIIRGAAREVARKEAPQTYGASGRAVPPPPMAARPLAVSRSL